MRKLAIVVLLAFAVTLGVVVGDRMSTEAMAVAVGVVCGVAAGIPMSVLIMAALTRRRDAEYGPSQTMPSRRPAPYPPIVVIQGGSPAPSSLSAPYYTQPAEATPRQFRIVGEDVE